MATKSSPLVLHLATAPEANELLARDPFALLAGMLLDQQVPMDWAFTGPFTLAQRLGSVDLDPAHIASHAEEKFTAIAAQGPAIHSHPGARAKRVQALARFYGTEYAGDAAASWRDVDDGAELLRRLKDLP